MGKNGDWKSEGYTISHSYKREPHPSFPEQVEKMLYVTAHHPVYGEVGKAIFYVGSKDHPDKYLYTKDSDVNKDHRRKGLATAMYQYAEKLHGRIFHDDSQTTDAKGLWSQPNRPFGNPGPKTKSKSKSKPKKKDWRDEGYRITHEMIPTTDLSDHDQRLYPDGCLRISAFDRHGNKVGHLGVDCNYKKQYAMPRGAFVEDEHQRKGIATAMYELAERISGKTLIPQEGHQSKEAKAFWSQPKRTFGRRSGK